jgi:hypothetical protein
MTEGDVPDHGQRGAEKRRHDRADVDGCAVLHALDGGVHCRIVNLSEGGLLLHAQDGGEELEPGTNVAIEVELETLGWVRHMGKVVRKDGDQLAIVFAPLPPKTLEAIADEVREATEATTRPRVVVVDPRPDRRRRVAAALRDAGARSIEASTPLEAVDLIERSRVRVTAVAVAESTRSQTESDELVGFLAEHHPRVQVAVISERTSNPRPGVRTLPGDEHADLHGPVRDLLRNRS